MKKSFSVIIGFLLHIIAFMKADDQKYHTIDVQTGKIVGEIR